MTDRRLASARRSDQSDRLSFRNRKTDIVKDFAFLFVVIIGETDVFETDVAVEVRMVFCAFSVLFDRFVDDLTETFESGDTLVELFHPLDQLSDRAGEETDGYDKGRIVTEIDESAI